MSVVNPYSDLLVRAAEEVREYAEKLPQSERAVLLAVEQFTKRLNAAASIASGPDLDAAMSGLARILIDELPLDGTLAPSFDVALDSWQRASKKRRRLLK